MVNHYSSSHYLIYAVCNTIVCSVFFYFVLAVQLTSSVPFPTTVLSTLAAVFRLFALTVQWSIWFKKPKYMHPLSRGETEPVLGWLQALFPVLVSISVALRIWGMLVRGRCDSTTMDPIHIMCSHYDEHDEITLALLMELAFNPILTFTLIRDTSIVAIWISWAINLTNLITYAVVLRSPDVIFATVSYTSSSILLYIDTQSHNLTTAELIEQLQATLAANEKLAVEAQAFELRAMIGNIAHDLKTPLTSFLSGVECMMEVVVSWQDLLIANSQVTLSKALGNLATIKTCLHSMHDTNSFMTMTINRCLDYTKASKGFKLVSKQETVSLSSMVELPLRMMRDAQSTIEIRVEPWDQRICTHIITDKQWLLENLLCLLSNAVKYSNAGHVNLGISLIDNPCAVNLEASDERIITHHLRFDLQDMGIGLSDEAMANLFAPFQQAQRMAGGTGLGLFSLARRVEALRGLYGVSKRPDGDKGSLFWFTIPYRPDEMSAAESMTVAVNSNVRLGVGHISSLSMDLSDNLPFAGPSTAPLTKTRLQILVVDDAPLIVRMTTMLLKRKGHTVEQAVNGAEALDRIVAAYAEDGTKPYDDSGTPAFDVVVMDLQMPIMDGIEAIRRVRAAEQDASKREQVVRRNAGSSPDFASSCGGFRGRGSGSNKSPYLTDEAVSSASAAAEEKRTSGDIEQGQGGVVGKTVTGDALRDNTNESKDSTEGEVTTRSLMRQRYHQFIVAVSANSDHETVQVALAAGADAFISKPFAYDSFQQAIEHRMKK